MIVETVFFLFITVCDKFINFSKFRYNLYMSMKRNIDCLEYLNILYN